tara:strand:- start:218 stop:550 length:333 start_codon:yes stop_codon:yes gene_type:complete
MRYTKNKIINNEDPAYKRYLKDRGMNKINHYSISKFSQPDLKDLSNFDRISHIWKTGDKYYKLAAEHYNDPTKWWVIALYNQKPTESHVKVGEVLFIPYPLDSVLYYMGY